MPASSGKQSRNYLCCAITFVSKWLVYRCASHHWRFKCGLTQQYIWHVICPEGNKQYNVTVGYRTWDKHLKDVFIKTEEAGDGVIAECYDPLSCVNVKSHTASYMMQFVYQSGETKHFGYPSGQEYHRVASIRVSSGHFVDQIEFTMDDHTMRTFGNAGGR